MKRTGHGTEDLRGALRDSCNDAMMQMVRSIGPANFAKYSREYGFGQKTGIDLPGEASTASLIFSEEQLAQTESNLAVSSFGQGFNVTMVQLASSFCSLINGGDLYQPHVVKKVVDDSGNTVQEINPVVLKETVSQEVSDTLRDYMYTVVSEGTGAKAVKPVQQRRFHVALETMWCRLLAMHLWKTHRSWCMWLLMCRM